MILFCIVFQVLGRYFCEDAATSSFISCFASAFISAGIIFYNLLELHSTLSEEDFCHKISFLNGFTQTSQPLNNQNLISVTKIFWPIFPKMPSENFLKKY